MQKTYFGLVANNNYDYKQPNQSQTRLGGPDFCSELEAGQVEGGKTICRSGCSTFHLPLSGQRESAISYGSITR